MEAAYVFRVTFRLSDAVVETDPSRFETVVRYPVSAPNPDADDDWRLFERWLWHGSLTDRRRFAERMTEWLDVGVERVSFSELIVDEEYLAALTAAISEEVDRYNADSAREVVHNHLGSSVRVLDR